MRAMLCSAHEHQNHDGEDTMKDFHVEGLPKAIRVAGFSFQIKVAHMLWAASAQRFGECSYMEQVIRLQEFFPTAEKAVDTLLHEIGHAIWWAYGLEVGDSEERIVAMQATAWMTFWRENPRVLDWITLALHMPPALSPDMMLSPTEIYMAKKGSKDDKST